MNRWSRRAVPVAAVVTLGLAAPPLVEAQLSPADQRQAETMASGILYLRVDAPCDYGRMVPLLVVSPENADAMGRIADLSEENRKEVYWQFGPNDGVQRIVLRWGIHSVRVWADGVNHNNEVMIDFVRIKTLDDFKKAFDRTFSRVPLQNEHTEWAQEIRAAIAARRVVEGMTKEQAGAVVGSPIAIETSAVAGVEVEIWRPRQKNGLQPRYRGESTLTDLPLSLKFEGGRLTVIEPAPAAAVPRKK